MLPNRIVNIQIDSNLQYVQYKLKLKNPLILKSYALPKIHKLRNKYQSRYSRKCKRSYLISQINKIRL